jgi:uncharacterized protein YdhG (YjbR/CyaY superfamily)
MTVEEYIAAIPADRIDQFNLIRNAIKQNLPDGFEECISYGMIGYVVPHSIYPNGYHCDPKLPLPFLSVASQKNSINLYHMGIYMNSNLLDWFVKSYTEQVKGKLDMGKSCIRFNPKKEIPFQLIGELCSKMTVKDWITVYEDQLNRR